MSLRLKIILFVTAMLISAAVTTGCSSRFTPAKTGAAGSSPLPSDSQRPANGKVQTNAEGNVTIEVEWGGAQDGSLVFNVSMDTHSIDLDGYDLARLAVLRDDTGQEYQPVSWNTAGGGHHQSGVLTFPLPDSVNQGKGKYVEMIIRGVAGIEERVLKWEL